MWPTAYAIVRTVRPKARATPSQPTPTSGLVVASTAVPQPPKTRTNVPRNSAVSFLPVLGVAAMTSPGVSGPEGRSSCEYGDPGVGSVGPQAEGAAVLSRTTSVVGSMTGS